MERWEFLLQKEGDTIWLPLESPDVEILEGRYRIVARSGHPETQMEVRVIHHAYEEVPPVRRVQTRTASTTPEGLMVVIPYTHLKPGIWDLCCSPHLGVGLSAESWQQSIKLQVLSPEAELGDQPHPHPGEVQQEAQHIVLPHIDNPGNRQESQIEFVGEMISDPPEAASPTEAVTHEGSTQWDSFSELAQKTEETTVSGEEPETISDEESSPQAQQETILDPTEPMEQIPSVREEESSPQAQQETVLDLTKPIEESPSVEEEESSPQAQQETVLDLTKPIEESPSVEEEESAPQAQQETIVDLTKPIEESLSVWEKPDKNTEVTPLSWELILNQMAYVATLGQGLLVSGQAQHPESTEATEISITQPQIHLCLRDPQTTEILTEVQQAVPSTQSPLPFAAVVYIPFECKTRLILGEVTLYSQTTALARQTFTITTQVEHLLQAIEEDFTDADELDEMDEMDEELPTAATVQLTLPLESEDSQPHGSEGEALSVSETALTKTPIQLPTFGHSLSEAIASSEAEEVKPETVTDSEESVEVTPASTPQPPQEIEPLSPAAQEFKHLNIHNRFWSRLNALAQDQDLFQWMKKSTPNALPETPFAASTSQQHPDEDPSDHQDSLSDAITDDLESQEIVIDDEPIESPPSFFPRPTSAPRLNPAPVDQAQPASPSEVLPQNQDIPSPMLKILANELVAGDSIPVQVRLPDHFSRIYVKIWVYDRQGRSIIDGPRWLTEFAPNGLEQIETTVNLDIPYGSLEVQVEAIAVEMQTQRESQKVTLERAVIPPQESSLPLEED